ncbi:Cytochrome c oxidase assembly protein COX11, mitochondrial [Quillaja saponaria]|uniref:Cytochrome c oxidase assembly protein COX11, mitochondrial n=1 Tax=Quillaja saponaria TaxID=32244 RepID=A0AAD7PCS1_QUISA|nr:Cytochrome c oxidase assembly protein COX11, mitochondrial [Quillaja saponaria]KAJ7950757.1 Cytochrome c oxidase assembly protein COX11, mitochondrial [Quillaja saponaria]
MIWSRSWLSRRTNLLSNLKNIQHSSTESRCIYSATEWSSSKLVNAHAGFQPIFSYNTRGLKLGHEFSTKSFNQFCQSSSFISQHAGRCYSLLTNQRQLSSHASREKNSQKMLLYLVGLVFAMVGCSYAAVPLYRRFCQATGYGGTIQRRESVEEKIARHVKDNTVTKREIAVQFNADVADGMPWKFIPTQREVRVKPGESALAFYTAENRSSTPIIGVSTYNVTPMKAAVYFNKIQCFCFEEQRLLPGEQIDMPVFFYIDPEFETDPKMDGINNLVLSYTFFKVSEE